MSKCRDVKSNTIIVDVVEMQCHQQQSYVIAEGVQKFHVVIAVDLDFEINTGESIKFKYIFMNTKEWSKKLRSFVAGKCLVLYIFSPSFICIAKYIFCRERFAFKSVIQ